MKRIITIIAAGLALVACTSKNNVPLLEGKTYCDLETEMAINYMPEDNLLSAQIIDIWPETDSTFSLNFETVRKADAYELYLGTKVYGVYLERGETLGIEIRPSEGETEGYELSFTGKNAVASEFASKMYAAYDIFEYGGPDDDGSVSNDEFMQKLENRHEELVAALETISDKKIRSEFAKQVEAGYNGLKIRLYMDKADQEDIEAKDIPGYSEAMAAVNPEDIYCLKAGSTFSWAFSLAENEPEFGGDYSGYCIELLGHVSSKVKNPTVKKALYMMIANNFFSYGDHETGKDEFWAAFCSAVGKTCPELIDSFLGEYEKVVVKVEEMPVPEVTLTLPNGKTTTLLEACKGKVTYIDVWATWCGPCCKEIPNLEKVVENMKGNKAINFISISVDEDVDAWQAKIANDKPEWAQYRVDSANNKALCDALNIRGIPRFMIVNSEGIIVAPDAIRPSNPDLQSTLESIE